MPAYEPSEYISPQQGNPVAPSPVTYGIPSDSDIAWLKQHAGAIIARGPPGWITWAIALATLYKLWLEIRKARKF